MSWNVNFYRNESLTSENFNGVNRGLLNRGLYHSDIYWGGSSAEGYHMNFNSGLVAVFEANGVVTKAVLDNDTTVQLGYELAVGDKVCIGYVNDNAEPVIRLNLLLSEGYSDILEVARWNGSRFSSNGYDTYRYNMVGGSSELSYYEQSTGKFHSIGNAYLADGEYTVNGDGLYGYNGTGFGGDSSANLSTGFSTSYLETSDTNLYKLLTKSCGSTFLSKVPCGFYPILYVENGIGVLFSDLRTKLGADWDFSYSPVKKVNDSLKFGNQTLLISGGSDTSNLITAEVATALGSLIRTAQATVSVTSTGDVDVTMNSTLGITSSTLVIASPMESDMIKAVNCGVYLKSVSSNKLTFKVNNSSTGSVSFSVMLVN